MRRCLVLLAMLFAAGCNTGGLLVIESTRDAGTETDGGPPVVLGPNTNEFVNSGTVAKNAKYRVVYSLGQGTPNQAPVTGKNSELHGGIIGASEGN
ncbi:Hypothetical protein A7982_07363 [Minicystis rosea]|nr:Hypothetical protein A7982_07363 [Minicystis rosea]